MSKAFLVLDDGRIFEGETWGASGRTFGEAVFATGMTGYQETLTDPSYHKQVVVMTAPHIGNTGWNLEDNESSRIWVAGFVVRNPSPIISNWRATSSLEEELIKQGIVGIKGVDTRALTRHLRDRGAMRVGIFSGEELTREEMVIEVRKVDQMSGSFLSSDVSTKEDYVVNPDHQQFHVVALDLTADVLRGNSEFKQFAGGVSDSGEGRWTVTAAVDLGVPAPVITTALYERFNSRNLGTFAAKILNGMRYMFGGHHVR